MANNGQVFQVDELVIHGGAENIRYPTYGTSKIITGNVLPLYYGYSCNFKAFGFGGWVKNQQGQWVVDTEASDADIELYTKLWSHRSGAPTNPSAHANGSPMVCAKLKLTSFSISRGSRMSLKVDYFELLPFPGPGIRAYRGDVIGNTYLWSCKHGNLVGPNALSGNGLIDGNGYMSGYSFVDEGSGYGYNGSSVACMGGYGGAGATLRAKLYVFPDDPNFYMDDNTERIYASDEVTILSNFPLENQWGAGRYASRNITLTTSTNIASNYRIVFVLYMIASCNCMQGAAGRWPIYAVELTKYFPKDGYVWRKFGTPETDADGMLIDPAKCDDNWHLVRPVYVMNNKGTGRKWSNIEGEDE